jgi:hypothetical protein
MHFFNRRPTQTNADILVRQTLPNKNLTALQAVVKLSNNHFPGVLIALSDTIRVKIQISSPAFRAGEATGTHPLFALIFEEP